MEQDIARQIREAFLAGSRDTLVDRMGITILEATAQRVVGTMPVEGNTQPYGILHGGASCVLTESLGSLGSALQAGPDPSGGYRVVAILPTDSSTEAAQAEPGPVETVYPVCVLAATCWLPRISGQR